MGAGIGVGASGVIMFSILTVDSRGAQADVAKAILSMMQRNLVTLDGVLCEASPRDTAEDSGLNILFVIVALDQSPGLSVDIRSDHFVAFY